MLLRMLTVTLIILAKYGECARYKIEKFEDEFIKEKEKIQLSASKEIAKKLPVGFNPPMILSGGRPARYGSEARLWRVKIENAGNYNWMLGLSEQKFMWQRLHFARDPTKKFWNPKRWVPNPFPNDLRTFYGIGPSGVQPGLPPNFGGNKIYLNGKNSKGRDHGADIKQRPGHLSAFYKGQQIIDILYYGNVAHGTMKMKPVGDDGTNEIWIMGLNRCKYQQTYTWIPMFQFNNVHDRIDGVNEQTVTFASIEDVKNYGNAHFAIEWPEWVEPQQG